jgi:UDP-3-O-[3-hydroxymyristoyl] glucosamine N-acyltransferase
MPLVSQTAVIHNVGLHTIADTAVIMDFAIIGLQNYYQDLFTHPDDRAIQIGEEVRIYPHAVVYEGARLGRGVVLEERTTVGSLTKIGARSRILYQAQVYDKVVIGEDCVIGGFVADNCVVGACCSVFGALVHRYAKMDTRTWDATDEEGPTLEENVMVGWGAVVAGAVRIGAGSRIFPNSVVTRDIERGAVYGRPGTED